MVAANAALKGSRVFCLSQSAFVGEEHAERTCSLMHSISEAGAVASDFLDDVLMIVHKNAEHAKLVIETPHQRSLRETQEACAELSKPHEEKSWKQLVL